MSAGSRWNVLGNLPGFTDEQCEKAFEEMKKRVADLLPIAQHDPHFTSEDRALINFLVARNYDVGQAEDMLRNYIKWRHDYKANELLTSNDLNPIFWEKYESGFSGHDREGNPIFVELPDGKLISELVKVATFEDCFKCHNYVIERRRQLTKHWGADMTTVIVDAKSVGLSIYANRSISSLLREFATHDQAMYPETLRNLFYINVPAAASLMFKALSPFLNPRVRSKVHLFSAGEWRSRIRAYVDDDGLSARLGGNAQEFYRIAEPNAYKMPPPPPFVVEKCKRGEPTSDSRAEVERCF